MTNPQVGRFGGQKRFWKKFSMHDGASKADASRGSWLLVAGALIITIVLLMWVFGVIP